jgi:hypothetical protein
LIVIAHFEESIDYYQRLEVVELEGDLMKALANKNPAKLSLLYDKLIKTKLSLRKSEVDLIKSKL